jgi:hypothetical protein
MIFNHLLLRGQTRWRRQAIGCGAALPASHDEEASSDQQNDTGNDGNRPRSRFRRTRRDLCFDSAILG